MLILLQTNAMALNGSFNITVKENVVTVTPSLSNDVTKYKWVFAGPTNGDSSWISSEDSKSAYYHLEYGEVYLITLMFTDGTNTGEYKKYISIDENETGPPTMDVTDNYPYNNFWEEIGFTKWFNSRTLPELFIGLVLIFLILFCIFIFTRKKKIYYRYPINRIKKKY